MADIDPIQFDQDYLDEYGPVAYPPRFLSLCAAVLEVSLTDLQHRKKRYNYQTALGWLLSDSVDHLFSFRNICKYLGLDPRKVRQSVFDKSYYELRRNRFQIGKRL